MPDVDRVLRRRVKFRKPVGMVIMPVRQHDIRGRIKIKPHSGGIRNQSLACTCIEKNPASFLFDEQ